ncbi:enoyl-CoA hydratase-related protein [Pseudonocardia thermophila]|uniref:enoyl-CoA hydratase-related protein n=1 Tax=Pseudonocardia thermophila TaxID=1848 RepID=UPI00248E4568|nr:enoyl-CoA hydratase-related protein [Pseudonocardia thermophila]
MIETYQYYSENFKFERDENGILTVRLNRPEKLNAFLYSMFDEIARLWHDVEEDPDTRVVIITGEGRAFSAGNDLSQPDADFEQTVKLLENGRKRTSRVLAISKPTIAAINGPAVGIGLAVALMCDITIAAEDAVLIEGHTKVGVTAGDHACLIWPLLMGMARAKYYALTSEPITGQDAERTGMVSKAVPKERVYEEAKEVARKLAGMNPRALAWTKRCMNFWLTNNLASYELSTALEMLNFFESDIVAARDEFRGVK